MCYSSAFGAGNVWFENVLISKTGNTTAVEFRFGCPTRYIDHFPLVETDRLQINLSRLDQCGAGAFGSPIREIRMPSGRALAGISEVEYVAKSGIDALLLVRFDYPVRFSVRQRRGLQSLQLLIELPESDDTKEPKPAPTVQPALPVVLAAPVPDADAVNQSLERLQRSQEAVAAQMSGQNTTPPAQGLFAINLESMTDPITTESIEAAGAAPDQRAYLTNVMLSGQTWYRLRLGFFSTESAANTAAKTLHSRFPDLWVVKVSEKERDNAGNSLTSKSSVTVPVAATLLTPAIPAVPAAPTKSATTSSPATES
ncbi:MAG: SPOR domain-containing protein, partial [Gammaproteobacteria bacterium]|nr:SPOR domain-containing protein [Gammaproteobacteria bacterium]